MNISFQQIRNMLLVTVLFISFSTFSMKSPTFFKINYSDQKLEYVVVLVACLAWRSASFRLLLE